MRRFANRQRQLGCGPGGGGGVGAGVFRGFAEELAVDAGCPQLQGVTVAGRDQYIAAVALALGLQAAALQQARQAFFHRIVALQPGRLFSLGFTGIERQGDVGAGGEQAEVGAQCPRSDLEIFAGALCHGLRRQQCQHRQRRQGQAEQRQVNGANQRAGCPGANTGHAGFPSIGWAEVQLNLLL
ncbi:hypothetical protein D3C84_759720 [compost metagenome]